MPCPKSRDIYKVYIRWCGIRDWTCLISAFLLLVYCTVIQQVRYEKKVAKKTTHLSIQEECNKKSQSLCRLRYQLPIVLQYFLYK